jgi:hypothetical protein
MIQSVMRERGYPVDDFETRAGDLSVEHSDVVQHYREGHQLGGAIRSRDKGSTEDLRRAMRHYRVLFDELVSPADGERPTEDTTSDDPSGTSMPSGELPATNDSSQTRVGERRPGTAL